MGNGGGGGVTLTMVGRGYELTEGRGFRGRAEEAEG